MCQAKQGLWTTTPNFAGASGCLTFLWGEYSSTVLKGEEEQVRFITAMDVETSLLGTGWRMADVVAQ